MDLPLPILTFNHIAIDQSAYEVFVDGEVLYLSKIDFEILCILAKRPRQVLSPFTISERSHSAKRAVTEHIRRIRKILPPHTITTVRGVGYRWDARVVGEPVPLT